MTQGEASDCMYLLMFGFLRAVQIDKQGTATTIGELSAGNVVGEIGCLFDEPRTASIYTIRDSVLLKMTRVTFSGLLEKHPRIMMGIVRQSVKRLVNPEKYSPLRDMSCFCILPAGKCAEVDIFSHAFVEELSKYGETKLITKDVINSLDANVLTSSALESAHNLSLFQMLVYQSACPGIDPPRHPSNVQKVSHDGIAGKTAPKSESCTQLSPFMRCEHVSARQRPHRDQKPPRS